ncbi:MAG: TRAP transporter large permease subunit [Gammaproteobacteria bacterium]|nr:TRAP transporter large permease subunit [Gammaproteobacteria bacterium]
MTELLPVVMFLLLAGLVFTSYPIAFILGGLSILFGVLGWWAGEFRLIEFFNFIGRIWFIAENLVIIAVPCFVFMGVMLERSHIAADLLEALQRLLGRVPGGLAMSVTLMGTIMAAITGIIGASVIVMTLIALPTMLREGYSAPLALGTIAAASTLGILIPPSILLVFLVDMLGISEGVLFAAALFPGLLLAGLYITYIFAFSLISPKSTPPLSKREYDEPLLPLVLRGFVPPVLLVTMVLGSIFSGFTTVTESAGVGALGAMILAWGRGRLTGPILKDVINRSTLMIGMIFFLYIGATCFAYVFRGLGGDDLILSGIDFAGLGPWGVLALFIFIVFIMGFFFDVLEILLIAVPLFAPIIIDLDFGTHLAQADVVYWLCILLAVTLQTSFLTPPMGLALFYIKGVAPASVRMRDIYIGIAPFVVLQLVCVGIVMAWPKLALWLPKALFG